MGCDIYSNGSNLTVQHSMNTLPNGWCPATWQDVFNQIAVSIIGTLQGTYGAFTIGSNIPSADDQDKLWLQLDAENNCAPMGFFIYTNGGWFRATPHPLMPGMILYHYDTAWAGKTDKEIRTLVEALDNYDAGLPFWYSCDGQNNTPDLRGRFVVGAGDGAGTGTPSLGAGLTARQLNVTGGQEAVQLTFADLPANLFTFNTTVEGIVTKIKGAAIPATDPRTVTTGGVNDPWAYNVAPFPTPSATAHNNLPPFRSLYAIMRSTRMI